MEKYWNRVCQYLIHNALLYSISSVPFCTLVWQFYQAIFRRDIPWLCQPRKVFVPCCVSCRPACRNWTWPLIGALCRVSKVIPASRQRCRSCGSKRWTHPFWSTMDGNSPSCGTWPMPWTDAVPCQISPCTWMKLLHTTAKYMKLKRFSNGPWATSSDCCADRKKLQNCANWRCSIEETPSTQLIWGIIHICCFTPVWNAVANSIELDCTLRPQLLNNYIL